MAGLYGNPNWDLSAPFRLSWALITIFTLVQTGFQVITKIAIAKPAITGVYGAIYDTKPLMLSNSGYSDVRGIETRLDAHFPAAVQCWCKPRYLLVFAGETGFNNVCLKKAPPG